VPRRVHRQAPALEQRLFRLVLARRGFSARQLLAA